MAELTWTPEEERRAERLAEAMKESFSKGVEAFHQLEAFTSEDPMEQAKVRAMYTIEEARINYEEASRELRRMEEGRRDAARRSEDQERDQRLEEIARSSKVATWLAVGVAAVSLIVTAVGVWKTLAPTACATTDATKTLTR